MSLSEGIAPSFGERVDYALSASIMGQQLDLLASSYERKCSVFQFGNGSHSLYALPWLKRKTCSQRVKISESYRNVDIGS